MGDSINRAQGRRKQSLHGAFLWPLPLWGWAAWVLSAGCSTQGADDAHERAAAPAASAPSDLDRALAEGALLLDVETARESYADRTAVGRIPSINTDYSVYFSRDGRLAGIVTVPAPERDHGQWWIASDGQVCLRWSSWSGGKDVCSLVYRQGVDYLRFDLAGKLVERQRLQPGNTLKLVLQTEAKPDEATPGR